MSTFANLGISSLTNGEIFVTFSFIERLCFGTRER